MATWLARVGAASMRRAWLVVIAWVVLLGGVLGGALALGPNMQESFEIPGTESQDALDRLGSVFPQVAGSSVQVVIQADGGVEAHREAIAEQAAEIERIDDVASVIDPWNEFASGQISDDGEVAFTRVQFEPSDGARPTGIDELVETADAVRAHGATVEFAGQAFQEQSVGVTWVEGLGVAFAGIVLFVAFWSLLAAGMPLITALVGVGITMGGVLGASALVTVSNSAPLMALMIGLAVGIDYALFILSRHRTQLARGMGIVESGSLAVGTAGTAVLFAGVTVIVAILGLLLVGIPFLSVMAIGAAVAVAIAVAAASTLLPALMALAGERLRPKPGSRAHRLAHRDPDAQPTMGMRWVKRVTRRPWVAIVASLLVAGVAAIPALSLDLALPDNSREPHGSTQRIANDILQESFGEGSTGALVVMVDITQTTDVMGTIEAVAGDLEAVPGVERIGSAFPDEGADTAIIQIQPETAPTDQATTEVVHAIRALAPQIEAEHGTPIAVTGATAVQIDLSERLGDALLPFGIVVVSLAFVILVLVFRSLLVPITAALGFLLSVLAAFGATVFVFQWGYGAELVQFEAGPILSFMPVLTMSVLFGLAMDYQMFLVSGMREAYAHGDDARTAVRHGFAANARVVTAAALIMFFVFFMFVPEGMVMIKSIAFGLAVGVAVDAFLVRMTLIPALMTLMGDAAWRMPRWLDRIVPHMDVEGESLGRHRAALDWARDADGHLTLASFAPQVPVLAEQDERMRWSAAVAKGALVRLGGEPSDRARLVHALVGDVDASGRARLGALALPGDAGALRRAIAVVDAADADGTALEAVATTLALTAAMSPTWSRRTRALAVLDRAGAAAGEAIDPSAPLSSLPGRTRIAVLVAAALEAKPEVVWIDGPHGAPAGSAEVASLLAPAETIVVVGTAGAAPDAPADAARAARAVLDLVPRLEAGRRHDATDAAQGAEASDTNGSIERGATSAARTTGGPR